MAREFNVMIYFDNKEQLAEFARQATQARMSRSAYGLSKLIDACDLPDPFFLDDMSSIEDNRAESGTDDEITLNGERCRCIHHAGDDPACPVHGGPQPEACTCLVPLDSGAMPHCPIHGGDS